MKRRFITVILAFFMITAHTALAPAAFAQEPARFEVQRITDGDTIVLSNGQRVRYLGINTPEIVHEERPAEPFGDIAKTYNREMVMGKQVRLEMDQQPYDHYGRRLAYIFLNDGTFVNAELVEKGYAYCLYKTPNTKYHAKLLAVQRQAMTARKGMWRNWHEERGNYLGNKRSRRFHIANCSFAKRSSPSNRQIFETQWEAFRKGYSPCKKCLPGAPGGRKK